MNQIRGWMSIGELRAIESWATEVPANGSIVEIGSYMGRSTFCWASSCLPSVSVYAVDVWAGEPSTHNFPSDVVKQHDFPLPTDVNTITTFLENVRGLDNIIPVHVPHTPIPDINPNIVFIDSTHKNPLEWDYIEHWLPKIVPGGIICGHDNFGDFPDVEENVRRLERILNQRVESPAGTLWSFRL
jgi:hypothetical protein